MDNTSTGITKKRSNFMKIVNSKSTVTDKIKGLCRVYNQTFELVSIGDKTVLYVNNIPLREFDCKIDNYLLLARELYEYSTNGLAFDLYKLGLF
jgi:hypothetical protein